MPVIEPSIRPPAEADSFLLQITTGCSANLCTFCGAYKGKPFRIKNEAEIYSDRELLYETYDIINGLEFGKDNLSLRSCF